MREIHEALNDSGIAISYRRLTDYASRIRKGGRELVCTAQEPSGATAPWAEPETGVRSADGFDPAANFRRHAKKQVTWEYPSGRPDESKLV